MIARIAVRPSRIISARAGAVRFYAENQFGRKEKAHEDEFIRKQQQEQLKKLQAELAKKKADTADLEKQIQEHEAKAGQQ